MEIKEHNHQIVVISLFLDDRTQGLFCGLYIINLINKNIQLSAFFAVILGLLCDIIGKYMG